MTTYFSLLTTYYLLTYLLTTYQAAFPKMGNVAALCGFVFLVFGIVGMELFKGE